MVASERTSSKNSLNAGHCDVVMGVPRRWIRSLTTQPYYRSTYVFVSAARPQARDVSSLDDPRLDELRIGIHVVGDDYAPPATLLARRGLAANLVGFSLFGAADEPNPPARLIEQWHAAMWISRSHGVRWPDISPRLPSALDDHAGLTRDVLACSVHLRHVGGGAEGRCSIARSKLDAALDAAMRSDCRRLLREYGVPQIAREDHVRHATLSPSAAASLR